MVRVRPLRFTARRREANLGRVLGFVLAIDLFLTGLATYFRPRWMGPAWIPSALLVGVAAARIETYKLRR